MGKYFCDRIESFGYMFQLGYVVDELLDFGGNSTLISLVAAEVCTPTISEQTPPFPVYVPAFVVSLSLFSS